MQFINKHILFIFKKGMRDGSRCYWNPRYSEIITRQNTAGLIKERINLLEDTKLFFILITT